MTQNTVLLKKNKFHKLISVKIMIFHRKIPHENYDFPQENDTNIELRHILKPKKLKLGPSSPSQR